MSILLLVGLIQAEMDEKGYVHVACKGWCSKDTIPEKPVKSIDHKPFERKKRAYKK